MFNRLAAGLQGEEGTMSTLEWNCSDPEGSKDSKSASALVKSRVWDSGPPASLSDAVFPSLQW